ncbi:MAG TPA: AMP-binding protein, partial [Pyrinomonadaceae bacterium]
FSFDVSVWEFFWPLITGARLVVAPPGLHRDPAGLSRLVVSERVTTLHFVPSMLAAFLEDSASAGCAATLRRVICSGEALGWPLRERFFERLGGVGLHNLYGPTEAAVDVTAWRCGEGDPVGVVPIGRPVANTQIYVLDVGMGVVPVGVTGELYIGGVQVGRGYLDRPALTAERFVPDPFSGEPGARLYKTGDVVRRLAGGEVEYLGRADHQVKVRGHRIELGEVESVICRHERVKEAAVASRDVGGSKQLVAYFVAEPGGGGASNGDAASNGNGAGVGETELRRFLSERLPEYMVPSLFVRLDALPLTPNGKLDRKALPEPGARSRVESFVAPRNAAELRLARVWEEVLGLSPVGIKDNFFQSGGHSLLAVRLVSLIEKEFGRLLPLSTLYQGATVEDMALRLGRGAEAAHGSLVKLREGGEGAPFFCVHPAGGNVFGYVELANRLGAGRPFYGLQARGLDGGPRHTSVEEMAAHYVGEVRAVQPEGPYMLGGWSLGGVVAFEMARRLESQGQRVALLALLDSYVPRPSAEDEDEAARLLSFARHTGLDPEHFGVSREQVARLGGGERLGHVLELAKAADLLPPDIGLAHVSRLWEVFEANLVAARDYRPGAYGGRVTVFKAGDGVGGRDAAAEWGPLAAGGVEVLSVPGDHFSFVREPHVGALAGALTACLERAGEA